VIDFLLLQYEAELTDYPARPPEFDGDAALWAAKMVYVAAQLILFREHKEEAINDLFPPDHAPTTPGSILSADLCLRFLPEMIKNLKAIDSEDLLIDLLEERIKKWHYSSVSYPLRIEALDFNEAYENPCLQHLYCDRIIRYKNLPLALIPFFKNKVQAQMGLYGKEFWSEFQLHVS
jgi:MoxR-vWA-beta-propeller ternary system domain bpX4